MLVADEVHVVHEPIHGVFFILHGRERAIQDWNTSRSTHLVQRRPCLEHIVKLAKELVSVY